MDSLYSLLIGVSVKHKTTGIEAQNHCQIYINIDFSYLPRDRLKVDSQFSIG